LPGEVKVPILEESLCMDFDFLFFFYHELPRVPGLFKLSLVDIVFFTLSISFNLYFFAWAFLCIPPVY
jgi:hypothetical protein